MQSHRYNIENSSPLSPTHSWHTHDSWSGQTVPWHSQAKPDSNHSLACKFEQFLALLFGLPLCSSSRTASALTSFISYLLFRSKNPHDKLSTTNYREFGAECRAFHRMLSSFQPNVAKLVLSVLPAYAGETIYRLCFQNITKCIGYEFSDHLFATIVFVYIRILAKITSSNCFRVKFSTRYYFNSD